MAPNRRPLDGVRDIPRLPLDYLRLPLNSLSCFIVQGNLTYFNQVSKGISRRGPGQAGLSQWGRRSPKFCILTYIYIYMHIYIYVYISFNGDNNNDDNNSTSTSNSNTIDSNSLPHVVFEAHVLPYFATCRNMFLH